MIRGLLVDVKRRVLSNLYAICLKKKKPDYDRVISTFTRRDDIATILPHGGVGIELGVAAGGFSERILKRSKLDFLYGVDMWADGGHVDEYKVAIRRLSPFKTRNALLKMRFDEALDLFPDEYFDFIYVDGYAHTGEEGGQTLRDWYPKLKKGGIFAGDDYSPSWPLVVEAVDKFIVQNNLKLHVIRIVPEEGAYSQSPTWFVIKPEQFIS